VDEEGVLLHPHEIPVALMAPLQLPPPYSETVGPARPRNEPLSWEAALKRQGIEMVNRYRAVAGMVDSSDGEYVPFEAYKQLLSERRELYELAISLVSQIAEGETTTDEAHKALAVSRRLEGY
jgi:hypothetical protein